MKPVVNKPNVTFGQLVEELQTVQNPEDLEVIKSQLLAKLQRKKRRLKGERAEAFDSKIRNAAGVVNRAN